MTTAIRKKGWYSRLWKLQFALAFAIILAPAGPTARAAAVTNTDGHWGVSIVFVGVSAHQNRIPNRHVVADDTAEPNDAIFDHGT